MLLGRQFTVPGALVKSRRVVEGAFVSSAGGTTSRRPSFGLNSKELHQRSVLEVQQQQDWLCVFLKSSGVRWLPDMETGRMSLH